MKKTEHYAIAMMTIIFSLGGVLLPATGLYMFKGADVTTVTFATLALIILFLFCLYHLVKAAK